MVIRKSTDEVEYLETALWAERLDRSFRETLEQNLSLLLASAPSSERDQVWVREFQHWHIARLRPQGAVLKR